MFAELVSSEKLRHDIEQFQYLIDERKLDADTKEFVMEEKAKYEELIPLMPDPQTISRFLDESERPPCLAGRSHGGSPEAQGPCCQPWFRPGSD